MWFVNILKILAIHKQKKNIPKSSFSVTQSLAASVSYLALCLKEKVRHFHSTELNLSAAAQVMQFSMLFACEIKMSNFHHSKDTDHAIFGVWHRKMTIQSCLTICISEWKKKKRLDKRIKNGYLGLGWAPGPQNLKKSNFSVHIFCITQRSLSSAISLVHTLLKRH